MYKWLSLHCLIAVGPLAAFNISHRINYNGATYWQTGRPAPQQFEAWQPQTHVSRHSQLNVATLSQPTCVNLRYTLSKHLHESQHYWWTTRQCRSASSGFVAFECLMCLECYRQHIITVQFSHGAQITGNLGVSVICSAMSTVCNKMFSLCSSHRG